MCLLDVRIPLEQCETKLDSLRNREDSSVPAYGVGYTANEPHNLKINSMGLEILKTEPIILEYDREAQTVRFTSKIFDYSQTGVPKDVTYAIGVTMDRVPQKIQV